MRRLESQAGVAGSESVRLFISAGHCRARQPPAAQHLARVTVAAARNPGPISENSEEPRRSAARRAHWQRRSKSDAAAPAPRLARGLAGIPCHGACGTVGALGFRRRVGQWRGSPGSAPDLRSERHRDCHTVFAGAGRDKALGPGRRDSP